MQATAKTANKNLIKDIVDSNLLLGLDGLLERITIQICKLYSLPPHMLSNIECAEIVKILDAHNLFLLRDSVNTVARLLPITRVTVYKYMRI
jgi:predicted transcriptional regulator YheO